MAAFAAMCDGEAPVFVFGGTNARYRSGLEELSKDGFKSPESKSKSNFKSPESKSKSNEASSVRTVGVPGLLQLHLQPLHPDLETIHRLYRSLSRGWVVEADEPKALALVGRPVDKHL